MKFKYRGCSIDPHTLRQDEGKWHYTVTVTTPLDARVVEETSLDDECQCKTEAEAIEAAKQHAMRFIDEHYP